MAPMLTGVQKAALLLVQMGTERSAKVLRNLSEAEVERLTAEIAQLDRVDEKIIDDVLGEFQSIASARAYYAQGGLSFAREVLETSLGPDKAREILDRLSATLVTVPFEFLRRADARQLVTFLAEEHPQTVALVIAHMRPEHAAVVLRGFPEDAQADIAHRLATMDRTSPDIVKRVEAVLERRLSSFMPAQAESSAVGGLEPLVEIINNSDRTTERLILEGLERRDAELAEQVRSQMFVFEDITTLDDRSVQLVVRQVESKDLATALKGVRADVRDKVLKNMSERAAANLQEEIELLGPVRVKTVEEAQANVVRVIRALEEAGQIAVSRSGADEYVV